MGLIAQALSGDVRSAANWLNEDEDDGPNTPSGVTVNRSTALSLTTIYRCWDLLASSVAMAPVDVTLKTGGKSFPEYNKPRWMTTPNPDDPNYDGSDYFGQVALSTVSDGNYFSAVFPYVLDPQVVILLDPTRVDVKPGPRYEVRDGNGKVIMTLDPMQMLHGWWLRPPGELRGISPLEALRRGIGSAVAAEEHAARFFGQGAALSFGVEVPYQMDPNKQTDLRNSLKAKYLGRRNSHAIGVLTDGAKFVGGLSPSPEQAQMLETRKFSVEDLCRPYGVPPSMAGSQEPGAASYASAAVWDMQFKQRAVQPLATRIERRHQRLLMVPLGINDPNATVQLRFNLDAIARADLLTRAQASKEFVQSGQKTPNEARALEDLPPLPGGDRLYMQSQMVPLEMIGVPPEPAPVTRSVEEEDMNEASVLRMVSAFSAANQRDPVVVNLNAESVRMDPPTIHMPETPAPIIQVNVPQGPAPQVTVEAGAAPVVNVTTPEQPAPVVNVTTPDTIRITQMPTRRTTRTVTKRTAAGIVETQDIEADL